MIKEMSLNYQMGMGLANSKMDNYLIDTTEIKSITIIPVTSFNNPDIPYPRTFPTISNDDKAITINIR